MERKNEYITDLSKKIAVIERAFSYDGEDYTEVLAYDKINDKLEYIATSYSEMQYYFNKDYIVFVKDDEVEFAFNNNRFSFITDEVEKIRAFKKILESSQIDYTDEERKVLKYCNEKKLAKRLEKRSK